MDWIFDNLQIVAIALIVVGSFVKQFIDARSGERAARKLLEEEAARRQLGELPDAEEEENYDDWGWQEPAEQPVPPPVPPPLFGNPQRPASAPPPLVRQGPPPPLTPQPPPLVAAAAAGSGLLERQLRMQEEFDRLREAKAQRTRQEAPTGVKAGRRRQMAEASGVRQHLSNRGELRRAIVLREVLGPPVGLR